MPDIQTEMKKVMQAWEQPYPLIETPKPTEQPTGKKSHMFTPINNVSQETFNYIRDNAGCSRKEAVEALMKKGHKKSSVSSLIGQMLRQGHIWRDSSKLLRPNAKEYTPLKSARTLINREKKAKEAKPAKTFKVKTSAPSQEAMGLAALAMGDFELTPKIVLKDRVQEIMDTISLPDAKRLHKALNEYFGSV